MAGEAGMVTAYLQGWADSRRTLLTILAAIPDDQLADILRAIREEDQVIRGRLTST